VTDIGPSTTGQGRTRREREGAGQTKGRKQLSSVAQ